MKKTRAGFLLRLKQLLDEALADAAIQLDVPTRDIDYEVLQKGTNSFLSFNKRNWIIRAYEIQKSGRKKRKQRQAEPEMEVRLISDRLLRIKTATHLSSALPTGVSESDASGRKRNQSDSAGCDGQDRERGIANVSEEKLLP